MPSPPASPREPAAKARRVSPAADGGGDGGEGVGSIVGLGNSSGAIKQVYNKWGGEDYDRDVREWGYDAPEVMTRMLAERLDALGTRSAADRAALRVLDAGVGTGLQGASLHAAGFRDLTGVDISDALLDKARGRGHYTALRAADLNVPLPFGDGEFGAAVCVGVLTYLDPAKDPNALAELARVVRKGGVVAFTSRTDKVDDWAEAKAALTRAGAWRELVVTGPLSYLPNNPDFAERIGYIAHFYEVAR